MLGNKEGKSKYATLPPVAENDVNKEKYMNFNKALLMGRLTKDPELRMTTGGTPVCEVGLAVNREYTTSTGEKKKDTLFIDVVFWNGRAGTIHEHAKKGSAIFVEGRLELDQWEKDGKTFSRIRLVADNFKFVGPRPAALEEATASEPTTTSA